MKLDRLGAIEQFKDWQHEQVDNFIAYLNKHRHRIVNYSYFQAEGISIGSGTIESTVKQIGARIKLSGAQWKVENVPQVLLYHFSKCQPQIKRQECMPILSMM